MSFLSGHAVDIRFRNAWPGKILMIAALALIGWVNVMPAVRHPDSLRIEAIAICVAMGAFYAALACLCLIPKIWDNRWFASFMIALLAFTAGKAFGWAIVEWMTPGWTRGYNYWLGTFPHLLMFDSKFMQALPALLLIIPIIAAATNRMAAAIAFLGMTLLMIIPGVPLAVGSGTAALVGMGFALLALVWPRAAISVVCFLIMIPLAAAGAGALGSFTFWNND